MKKGFWIVVFLLFIGLGFVALTLSQSVTRLEQELYKNKAVSTEVNSVPDVIDSVPARMDENDNLLEPNITYKDTGSVKRVKFIVYDTLKESFDTLAFLQQFLAMNMFRDSVYIDDVSLVVLDTLQRNRSIGRSYSLMNYRNEDFYKKRMLYASGAILGSSVPFGSAQGPRGTVMMFGVSLDYLDKSRNIFGLSGLIGPSGDKGILVKYGRRLF